MTAAGIWIRVSTADQVTGESPERHEARARAYAEAKEWEVVTVYRLDAVSGKSVTGHPECKRMLADVARGDVSALVFSNLSRLARNTRELLEFADHFEEFGADMVSLAEAIDTSTPAGRMFFTVKAALAQFEREEISARVAASVPIRARQGKPLGGPAAYGYRWENQELVPDEAEAPVRRLIYELFERERRIRTVASLLNERGHRTRRGAEWSDTTVKRLLRDPTAKGKRRANYTQAAKGRDRAWELKPESDWIWHDVPAIVSEELWETCNAILDERARTNKRKPKKAKHPFAGILFCGCDAKMYVTYPGKKYVCTRKGCRRKIAIEDIEVVFQEQLRGFFVDPDEVKRHLTASSEELTAKQDLLAQLRSDELRIQKEMDAVFALYTAQTISMDGFAERYGPLEIRRNQIRDEIPRTEGEIDFLRTTLLGADAFISESQELYDRFPQMTQGEKRRVVESICRRIVLDGDTIRIDLAFQPIPAQTATKGHRNLTDSSLPGAGSGRGT